MDKHHIQILYKFQPEHQLLQKQSSPHPQIYSYQVVSMVELKVTLHTQLQHNCKGVNGDLELTFLKETTFYEFDVFIPIKSLIRRPSENRPVGYLKKVSPYGQKFA